MSTLTAERAALYGKAVRHLSRRDPALKALIKRVGPCTMMPVSDDPLTVLVRCVIYQQISTKAATSIFNRLAERLGGPPLPMAALLAATADDLRACGISGPKQRAIRAVLDHAAAEAGFLAGLAALPDDELRASVTRIKGFGPWSADMLMMFGLLRPDVLPVGDLGLRVAIRKHYGLAELPKPAEVTAIGEKWRPYRSIATWYMWRSLDQGGEMI
jgi:DNA-3-methyladenine glycosylase II